MNSNERRPLRAPSESAGKTTSSRVGEGSDAQARSDSDHDPTDVNDKTRRGSQESRFQDFVSSRVDVFLAQDGQAYGCRHAIPHRAAPVGGGGGLVDELALEFFAVNQVYPSARARAAVVDLLRMRASIEEGRHVFLRSAWLRTEGTVLIDTGNSAGEVIVVSADGWKIQQDGVHVAFRRTRITSELTIHHEAVPRQDALRLLKDLAPLRERDVPILLALLLTSWLTDVPQPIVLVTGPRDSGKTSTARFLVSLVDPTTIPRGGGLPANEAGWKAAANTARVQVLDNVGHINADTSDLLCRVSSGGEITTRALYTDDTPHVTWLQAPVWITSVDPGVLREDLASRFVTLPLEPLNASTRLAESELQRRQDQARPRLTRALLDLMVDVLGQLPQLPSTGLTHRMGDFERVLRCVDQLLATDGVARLGEQSLDLAADVLDSDPIAQAFIRFCRHEVPDAGDSREFSPTKLKQGLSERAADDAARSRSWPRSPGVVTSHLTRIAPTLETVHRIRVTTGLRVGKSRDRKTRIERLRADGSP